MQQTDKYKLNLIEKDDAFSPDALNGNAERVEQELARLDRADAAEAAGREALADRVTVLEAPKIFFGQVAHEGANEATVELGFTPKAVLMINRDIGEIALMVIGDRYPYHMSGGREYVPLRIVENGFALRYFSNVGFFAPGSDYNYIAFA